MLPPKLSHVQTPSWPTHFHRSLCTNPNRPPLEQPPITATFRQTSMPSSSSLLLPASCPQQTPTNRPPPFPPPAALSPPHHPIPHQPPTNNHTIDGNASTSFPLPPSPCRNSHTLLRHFPPPSAAHRATDVPRHLLAPLPPPAPGSRPDPRAGSPTPQRTTPATNRQSTATVHPLPKRPPPSLYQAQQPPATTEPLQPVPPATGWPCFQGGSYTPTPSVAPPATVAPPTHPWPAHYHFPTQQPPFIPPQASSSDLAPHPPRSHTPPFHDKGGQAGAPPAIVSTRL